jgi:class 3 adenylate cyclase
MLIDRLGPLSPFATLETFSPAARMLLETAERDVERLLHLVRLVVVVVATVIGYFAFHLVDYLPRLWLPTVAGVVGFAAFWIAVWRRLGRGHPSLGLRCGLIAFDGLMIARGILLFHDPGGLMARFDPELYRILAGGTITRADVEAVTPPMLVLLALTGGFRLDFRLAVFSTAIALLVFAHFRLVFPAPPQQTWVVVAVIWFAGALGANAARAFRWIALKASQERLLERYVPAALTQEILRSGNPDRAGRVEEITVLIADIRGFTRLSESLGPVAAVDLLNECFGVLVGPLGDQHAVIDKYVGDGLLAFFEGERHAERALRAARRMLMAMDAFNQGRSNDAPVRVGIAVHTGGGLLGTVGAGSRRDYTLIGDVVNVAARLEEMNKHFGSSLVVSDDTLRLAPADTGSGLIGPTTVEVRGRGSGVRIHWLSAPADAPIDCASARTQT